MDPEATFRPSDAAEWRSVRSRYAEDDAVVVRDLAGRIGLTVAALQLLPGDGPTVGGPLTSDPRIAGVCFTGSTEVARIIQKALAENAGADAVLIAETGGLNATIADSTALTEQAVRDILIASFQSVGQRCSALRMTGTGIPPRALPCSATRLAPSAHSPCTERERHGHQDT